MNDKMGQPRKGIKEIAKALKRSGLGGGSQHDSPTTQHLTMHGKDPTTENGPSSNAVMPRLRPHVRDARLKKASQAGRRRTTRGPDTLQQGVWVLF